MKHTDLSDKEVDGVIDHANYSVTKDKLRSNIDASDIGFDADKLDGYHASQLVRLATIQTISGLKTFNTLPRSAVLVPTLDNELVTRSHFRDRMADPSFQLSVPAAQWCTSWELIGSMPLPTKVSSTQLTFTSSTPGGSARSEIPIPPGGTNIRLLWEIELFWETDALGPQSVSILDPPIAFAGQGIELQSHIGYGVGAYVYDGGWPHYLALGNLGDALHTYRFVAYTDGNTHIYVDGDYVGYIDEVPDLSLVTELNALRVAHAQPDLGGPPETTTTTIRGYRLVIPQTV